MGPFKTIPYKQKSLISEDDSTFFWRICKVVEICDTEMGFMQGKFTANAVFAVKQLIENYKLEGNCILFSYLVKAFNCVPREVVCWAQQKKRLVEPEMKEVMQMSKEAETSVKLDGKMSQWFQAKVRVLKGMVLSQWLSVTVVRALTAHLAKTMKELLHVDTIVVVGYD